MTSQLPPNLLRLFAPRPPLKYLPPVDKESKQRRPPTYSSLSGFLEYCVGHDVDFKELAIAKNNEKIKKIALQRSSNLEKLNSDPYKTLFVANLSFDTTEKKLYREFESFGPIKSVVIVMSTIKQSPRGYAFVEFENEADMKKAFKECDGMRIEGRKILVDVERGRTVKGWNPRSLAGGLGDKRSGIVVRQVRQGDARAQKAFLGGISKEVFRGKRPSTARPPRRESFRDQDGKDSFGSRDKRDSFRDRDQRDRNDRRGFRDRDPRDRDRDDRGRRDYNSRRDDRGPRRDDRDVRRDDGYRRRSRSPRRDLFFILTIEDTRVNR